MESIIEFLNMILEAVNSSGDHFDTFIERAIHWSIVQYFTLKIAVIEFSYSIAKTFLQNVGISAALESAWSGIDSQILSVFTYLRIPEGLNLVISAATTRFIMDLMP